MPGPISPDEVQGRKETRIPEAVYEVVNDLIAVHWNGHSARVTQEEVVIRLIAKIPELTRERIFDEHMLDVEGAYRRLGWAVVYDKPGFNESYPAAFTFTKSRR